MFCYADDILLCSLTVTGLQRLIDVANMYISSHGLCFNPTKTECIIFGPRCFTSDPKWYLNGVSLGEMDVIKYLMSNVKVIVKIVCLLVGGLSTASKVPVYVILCPMSMSHLMFLTRQ